MAGAEVSDIFDLISDAARAEARMRNAYVETRILEGADRVELPYLPGGNDSRRQVWFVPTWKQHPIQRWRIARARRAFRRQRRLESWGQR